LGLVALKKFDMKLDGAITVAFIVLSKKSSIV